MYKGDPKLIRDGSINTIKKGERLVKNDRIKTDKNSKLRIKFNDNTLISMGMNSDLLVNDYVYSGKKSEVDFKFSGALKAVTGKIGKLTPERFKINTKTATIGIRGTLFYMDTNTKEEIACLKGAITEKPEDSSTIVVKVENIAPINSGVSQEETREYTLDEIMALGKLIGLPKSEILNDYYNSKSKEEEIVKETNIHKVDRTLRDLIIGVGF